ncbi:hypothetical protein RRF57_005207 [Xylaria bambusicola]|uniref:Uncharacterized protein n=1 Tax=Xylaria bambusicola TaxID=326684 RepID=A0AAN7Z4K0_9PEZI
MATLWDARVCRIVGFRLRYIWQPTVRLHDGRYGKEDKVLPFADEQIIFLVVASGDGEFCTGASGHADILFQLPPGLDQLDGAVYGNVTS